MVINNIYKMLFNFGKCKCLHTGQCGIAASKGNQMLGLIKIKGKKLIIPLYKATVRPQLEILYTSMETIS